MQIPFRSSICAAGLACVAATAAAQGPAGAKTLTPNAVNDSLLVLAMLDSTVRTTPGDAAAWYRRGMIAWALGDRARAKPEIAALDWTSLGHMADTSLRRAADAAPRNPLYRLSIGKYLLSSGLAITRFSSGSEFDSALALARHDSNGLVHAEAAIEAGRTHWRRYDARENRRMETTPGAGIRSIVAASNTVADENGNSSALSLKNARDLLEQNTMPLPPELNGQADYDAAETLFHEAYDAAPDLPRAFRQYAMLIAAKDRWTELATLARGRVTKAPWDGWAWMTLGLAMQRQKDSRFAAVAFDSAMKNLDPSERARLDRIERILRKSDTAFMERGSEADRAAKLRLYWMFADPLWSRDGNESRIEYLARVTYAELRWTVEELDVHGLDSDRGDIYVRYGPPDIRASFGVDLSQNIETYSTIWAYRTGLMFSFEGAPMYATMRTTLEDQGYVSEVKEAKPVQWDNLSAYKIDSMPTQVARFRGGRDSVDVLVAAEPAYDRIKKSSELGFAPRTDFWLLAGGTVKVFQDSGRLNGPGVRSWTHRVGQGNYVYRVEASTDGGTIAARAAAPIVASVDPLTSFSPHGFGLSDLLLTSSVEPGPTAGPRWRELKLTPIAGTIAFKTELSLVWENYEFGNKDGSAQYHVTVIVQREKSGAGRLMARIIGGVSSAVGIERTDDRVAMRFDRAIPYRAAFSDYVSIGLEETPPGSYRVTLEVTDTVTQKTVARTALFTVK